MSELNLYIKQIEEKFAALAERNQTLKHTVDSLSDELIRTKTAMHELSKELAAEKRLCNELKIANSLLGSEDYKRETKQKINSIIREIDQCVAQLNRE